MLQHGLGRSARFWYRWIPYLARHYRIVVPDLRGFGRSPIDFDPATSYSLDELTADFLAIIDQVGSGIGDDRPVHYCGEAMGGTLGAAFAAQHPDRFRSLTLVASPVGISPATRQAFCFGHPTWSDALRIMGTKAWARAANTSKRFPPGTPAGLMEWYADQMGDTAAEVMIALSEAVSGVDWKPYLAMVPVPTLALYPSDGLVTGPEEDQIRSLITGVRLVNLPTAYHSIQFVMAAECVREVLRFTAEIDGVPYQESSPMDVSQ